MAACTKPAKVQARLSPNTEKDEANTDSQPYSRYILQ